MRRLCFLAASTASWATFCRKRNLQGKNLLLHQREKYIYRQLLSSFASEALNGEHSVPLKAANPSLL